MKQCIDCGIDLPYDAPKWVIRCKKCYFAYKRGDNYAPSIYTRKKSKYQPCTCEDWPCCGHER